MKPFKLFALTLLLVPTSVSAATITPGMTTTQIQTAITSAAAGSTISFSAGTYSITSSLAIPCSNLQLTGPTMVGGAAPGGVPTASPVAILYALFSNAALFNYPANCQQMGSVKYLGFKNAGAVYVWAGANFDFEFNQVVSLPSAGLFFDGNLGTTLSNVTIKNNVIGDGASCTAQFAQTNPDPGGYCAGVITSQGVVNGITIQSNTFNHVEEGIHFNQMANWSPGSQGSVCISCDIEYNTIRNYHRIGIEIQTGTPTNSMIVAHNAVLDPLNSFFGTFAVSLACCQWSATMATDGFSPGVIFNDNVVIASTPCGPQCPPYGVEFWGNGSQGTNSLVEGSFSNGYTWGYGAGSWAITNNTICGPNYLSQGGYITNQQGQNNPPIMTNNATAGTCQAKTSSAPNVSPASGTFTGSQSVAIAATGNASVWYTTDGSVPVPGTAKLYTGPFSVTQTTTVKAVSMWGAPNQPTNYPAGYGYVPSPVVSATYTLTQNCTQLLLNPQAGTYKSSTVPCS